MSLSVTVSLFLSFIYIYGLIKGAHTPTLLRTRFLSHRRRHHPKLKTIRVALELVRVLTDSCMCIYMQTVNAVFEPRKLGVYAVQYKVTLDIS